jgi:osmotically-inducible protein OsmY
MKDTALRHDILEALEFEPSLDAADIAVSVEDGTVTLAGHVPSFAQKRMAERIAARVQGVRAIAQELEVRLAGEHTDADDEIAARAVAALRYDGTVPSDAIQVKVEKGRVTLTGDVEWAYERHAAEAAIEPLAGVRSIFNQIVIAPKHVPAGLRGRIEAALARDALLHNSDIRVDVAGASVTLDGSVRSLAERAAAERAAWSAPGVTTVVDRLAIRP